MSGHTVPVEDYLMLTAASNVWSTNDISALLTETTLRPGTERNSVYQPPSVSESLEEVAMKGPKLPVESSVMLEKADSFKSTADERPAKMPLPSKGHEHHDASRDSNSPDNVSPEAVVPATQIRSTIPPSESSPPAPGRDIEPEESYGTEPTSSDDQDDAACTDSDEERGTAETIIRTRSENARYVIDLAHECDGEFI